MKECRLLYDALLIIAISHNLDPDNPLSRPSAQDSKCAGLTHLHGLSMASVAADYVTMDMPFVVDLTSA